MGKATLLAKPHLAGLLTAGFQIEGFPSTASPAFHFSDLLGKGLLLFSQISQIPCEHKGLAALTVALAAGAGTAAGPCFTEKHSWQGEASGVDCLSSRREGRWQPGGRLGRELCAVLALLSKGEIEPHVWLCGPWRARHQSTGTLLGKESCQPCQTSHTAWTGLRGPDLSCM